MKSYEIPGFPHVKIRRTTWNLSSYIRLVDNRWSDDSDEPIEKTTLFQLFSQDDWFPYQEPKKKVKMWQWVIKNYQGEYYVPNRFMTEEKARKDHGSEIFKKLDYTEIEADQ